MTPRGLWRPSRRVVLAALLAAGCAMVLDRGAYWGFERVRIKVVTTEQPAVGTTLEVPLPDLSALAGQPLALVLRLRTEERDPVAITAALDEEMIGTATVAPGPPVRVDVSAGPDAAAASPRRLELEGDRAGWTLTYFEIGNIHGHSQDPFGLVIVPRRAVGDASVSSLASILVFAALFGLSRRSLWRGVPRAVRAAGVGLGVIVGALFLSVLVAPLVSPYAVLLSPKAFLIGLACLYVPACWTDAGVFLRRLLAALVRLLVVAWRAVVRVLPIVPYLAVVTIFLVSLSGFYDPQTGFTGLIMFGEQLDEQAVPALRALPHHIVSDSSGYDGQYYAQLALDPLLRDPATLGAVDVPLYRARRILFSWTAFLLGLGRVEWVVEAYALQNVLCWLALAWLLLRWMPPGSPRYFAVWVGCLFSQGLMTSVRFAVLEGPSLLLLVLTMLALETGRPWLAAAVAGVSGLGRETNLLNGAALVTWRNRWPRRAEVRRLVVQAAVLVAPFGLWLAYVSYPGWPAFDMGGRNFAAPPFGYLEFWADTVSSLRADGWASVARFKLLVLISLTTQAVVLVSRPRWRDPWWRVGVVYAGFMLVLGSAVWEGHPGAAARVLLPLTLAFNVGLPKGRAFWLLFVLGNLTIAGGMDVLQVWWVWQFV